jgi:peptidoglycan/LPS O-acetylase OafA/YrhL
VLVVAALLMIPVFVSPLAYPLNGPAWSLFFELAASVGYTIERRKMTLWALLVATSVAGLILGGLILCGGHVVNFGVGGKSFVLGFVRVAYPFGAGILISRAGIGLRLPSVPDYAIALGLTAILLLPFSSGMYDLLAVTVAMPSLVALGSNARSSTLSRAWPFVGRMSYPVYLLNAPILEAFRLMVPLPPPANAVAAIFTILAVSFLALVGFDEPVRKWAASLRWRSPQPADTSAESN